MTIEKEIKPVGSKGEHDLVGVFDGGATYSYIGRSLAVSLGTVEPLPSPLRLGTAEEGGSVRAEERVTLDFHLDGYRFSDEFMVIDRLPEQLIIGAATMQKWRFRLDFEREGVIIDPRVTKLRLL